MSGRGKAGENERAKAWRHRLNAGRHAVMAQTDFFERQFGDVSSSWKEDDSRVTFADFAISEHVFAELRRDFPGDAFCSEESSLDDDPVPTGDGFAWVIDPIDGTNNYALGLPICAISLALLENGVPVYGWVYDFPGRRLLHGGPGEGCFVGNRKFVPIDEPFDHRSVIGVQFPLEAERLQRLEPLLREYRCRSLGSGTLIAAYTALGIFAGAVDYRVKVWDFAAAYAICGGSGREFQFIGESPFPMSAFHPKMAANPYYAGREEFCRFVEGTILVPGPTNPPRNV